MFAISKILSLSYFCCEWTGRFRWKKARVTNAGRCAWSKFGTTAVGGEGWLLLLFAQRYVISYKCTEHNCASYLLYYAYLYSTICQNYRGTREGVKCQ